MNIRQAKKITRKLTRNLMPVGRIAKAIRVTRRYFKGCYSKVPLTHREVLAIARECNDMVIL